jgi:hypothetical protein
MPIKLGWIEASEDILARANAWHVGRGEMTPAAKQLARESEEMMANIAKALDIVSKKMETEMPLNRSLPGIIAAGSKAARAVGTALAPFGTAFQRLHGHDIARQETPRRGEEAWDTRA